MPIRQLAPDVAAKIAAGEVVERPASVVKELIENSIDAGAGQIRVDLMNGGLQLIRVIDNGSGIPADELQLALARHATSKVAQIDDLEHIRSLGFRGEALASIAAVAEVTLLSRHRGAEQGAQFLKSRNTEVSHCLHMLEQYALAYPEIRFNVFSEGRQIFSTPGDGQLSSVLIEIYGLQVAEQMVPISSLDGREEDPERPVVTGYTSLPACYKSTRQHISFFVNRRWVLSRMLTIAVEEAYHSLLLAGRHPIAVVNISLDPTLLDVNVHPAKTEIRFLKERRVYAAVLRAVRRALLEEAEMPTWGNNNKLAVGNQGAINRPPTPLSEDNVGPANTDQLTAPNIGIPDTDAPDNDALTPTFPQDPWLTVTEEETGTKPPLLSRLWQSHIRNDEPVGKKEDKVSSTDGMGTLGAPIPSVLDTTQQTRRLPSLRVIGQLSQSYIVTEGPEGMYLIDQHAAHERILLERMVAALKARTPISQMLLTPMQLELAPKELEAIEDHLQQLEQIGFILEILDNNTLVVRAVPNVLVKKMNARSLRDLLADLTAPENPGHTETWEEHALANVACKAAIKANYFLTVSEMREMIEQLERTNAPYSCCHGRPTMVHFSLSALEHEFGRR